MGVTHSWIAGREAVLAFSKLCLDERWIFAEIPEQADFGKDGYVDLTGPSGETFGNSFAVQIKGGRTRWTTRGYRIDANDRQRQFWRDSTMPVIGIAHDPDRDEMYWTDLSATLRDDGLEAELIVPIEQRLDDGEGRRQFMKKILAATHQSTSILDLVSEDAERQVEAVFSCYVLGRIDGRALVLLRSLMFKLKQDAFLYAISVLIHAVPHPDIFHTFENLIERDARTLLAPHIRWSVQEGLRLLQAVDDDGIDRGTLGQDIFQLLVADPDHITLVGDVAVAAVNAGDKRSAGWAVTIATYLAGDNGREALESLLRRDPRLSGVWSISEIRQILDDFGWLNLF